MLGGGNAYELAQVFFWNLTVVVCNHTPTSFS